MKMSVTTTQFIDEFKNYNRGNQFSYEALCALFDYYEEFDENYELDVIAICCEWTEYESLEDACDAYSVEYDDFEANVEDILDEIDKNVGCMIELDNGSILISD